MGGKDDLPERAENDGAVEGQRPVLDIDQVGFQAGFDVRAPHNLAAEPADLCQPGDARFNKGAKLVIGQQGGEPMVVFHQMRPGSDDAHLSGQHVEELREFIHAESTQETADGKDAAIAHGGLFRLL
jgi:hypothetical protein